MNVAEKCGLAPLDTRMRWYAEMNSWRIPSDFPVTLPDFADRDTQFRNPEWRAAFDGLRSTMTQQQMSLGWWLYSSMSRTVEEWMDWYFNGRGPTADEILKKAPQP